MVSRSKPKKLVGTFNFSVFSDEKLPVCLEVLDAVFHDMSNFGQTDVQTNKHTNKPTNIRTMCFISIDERRAFLNEEMPYQVVKGYYYIETLAVDRWTYS